MLRVRQSLGKYKIRRRIARGGFGDVFQAYDTIEGVQVALKVPLDPSDEELDHFIQEVRLTARLDHPNILPVKDADFIDGVFVLVQPLGLTSLESIFWTYEQSPLGPRLDCVMQILAGLQHAHDRSVIHCDIKPDNIIVFSDDRLRIGDFGIAKHGRKTVPGSGSGSLGYTAPEQAMGKPSPRSDVFSTGMILHRLLTGSMPSWPFEWPFPFPRMKEYHPSLQKVVRRSLMVDSRKRYPSADVMRRAIESVFVKAIDYEARSQR